MDETATKSLSTPSSLASSSLVPPSLIPPSPPRPYIDPNTNIVKRYVRFFRLLAKNPLEVYSKAFFDEDIVDGEIFGANFATISNPDGIRHFLVTNAKNYGFNRLREEILVPLLREGLLVVEGDLWKHTRGALTTVFTPRYVAGLADTMALVAREHADRVATANVDGAPLKVSDAMVDITLDVLMRCMFPASQLVDKPSGQSSGMGAHNAGFDAKRFTENIDILLTDYSSPHFLDFVGAPKWIPRTGHARRDRVVRDVQAQLRGVVMARRKEIEAAETEKAKDNTVNNDGDLLSLLLTAGRDGGTPLSDDQVIDNMITFLAAGHETSARSLAWTFYLVSEAPDWAAKITEELDRVDLDALAPSEWQNALPVLTAVLKESMRLYPAAGVISREAKVDDTICDQAIPKGTLVSAAPWVLHRHSKLWENPDAFDPSRFIGDAVKAIPRFAYLPFGAGPRVCIGASFAMREMIIILAVYLKRFTFTHVGKDHPMPIMNLTVRPSTDLEMQVKARE
ncbi:cytochrome P450 [Kordiimonas sp. SCSIO 12610]|uniref:cytochrome P450 n=1 Tax=Kordiimonas sp. SCSIO 12610 TaxID=2829597 RepID=UPI00210C746D|nr:cytochrome P450 [Kordiimonas sp. SCSIO 12610]UTW56108.1 cytochrome P450 [Kordiimonas sp. SCSIO 12610]